MIVNWNTDHAASGDRARAFVENYDVIVYAEGGNWAIRCALHEVACGTEADQERGKARALLVLAALMEPLS